MTPQPQAVWNRFSQFSVNLALTDAQQADGTGKHRGVRRVLNQHYYGVSNDLSNSMLVGSWGKSTEVRPPRDIDVLFWLPRAVYDKSQAISWPRNRQSELLQEVKRVLALEYPKTSMRGDGQVVMVGFGSYAIEVVPAFALSSGACLICDTNSGGSYKTIRPNAEQDAVRASSERTKGNTRSLIRMLKAWQGSCSVPIKSFWFELLAVEFLNAWPHASESATYYDCMVRDFLAHLIRREGGAVSVPGTTEAINLGRDWKSKAETAYARALKACAATSEFEAGTEWQKIFGNQMPLVP